MPPLVTADDYGLSKGINDSILETVDCGAVQEVSVIVNGDALVDAAEKYASRRTHLKLALHLNLTEGKPLAPVSEIPLLVDERGYFNYSVMGLWLAFFFASRATRAALRAQVAREIDAQAAALRDAFGEEVTRANGHQHVHMIPFVWEALIALPGLKRVRLTYEPSYLVPGAPFAHISKHGIGRIVLALVAGRNKRSARARGITTNDYFLGELCAGHVTSAGLTAGMSAITRLPPGATEILLHPGSALPGELVAWQASGADVSWHYAPERARERALLKV